MLRADLRDSSNGKSSEMMDLMARSASIKQRNDMSLLSRSNRLHGIFGSIRALEHTVFILKNEPIT